LTSDVSELGLLADDRLEPCTELPNVGNFEELQVPAKVMFWRRSAETLCRHRNPMMDASLGLEPEDAITVDTLHALYLGVMNTFCSVAIWVILDGCVYASTSGEEGTKLALLGLRASLLEWYKQRHAKYPSENLTRVADFTPSMAGTRGDPKCKTKGAETWGMCLFLLDELRKFGDRLGGEWIRLLAAGESLEAMVLAWRQCGWVVPENVITVVPIVPRCGGVFRWCCTVLHTVSLKSAAA
jgi:hypothetical protein